MRSTLMKGLAVSAIVLAPTLALAQTTTGGMNSATPERGAGVQGVGAPAEGRSNNQPGSAAQPNPAAATGPSANNGSMDRMKSPATNPR